MTKQIEITRHCPSVAVFSADQKNQFFKEFFIFFVKSEKKQKTLLVNMFLREIMSK